MDKKKFVEHELARLLYAIDGDIFKVNYVKGKAEEYVWIIYVNHSQKRICVTGDSLLAIVKHVIKHLD